MEPDDEQVNNVRGAGLSDLLDLGIFTVYWHYLLSFSQHYWLKEAILSVHSIQNVYL
jgi:hypothetical protein